MIRFVVLLANFMVLACSSPATNRAIDDLAERFDALESRIEAIESKNAVRELLDRIGNTAYLTPGDSGYSLLETNHGAVAVSFQDISAFASGSRVTLRFGNTTGADFDGISARVEWGAVGDAGVPDVENERNKEVSFTEDFRRSSWTDVRVVLDGTPPASVGFIRVSNLSIESISLTTR